MSAVDASQRLLSLKACDLNFINKTNQKRVDFQIPMMSTVLSNEASLEFADVLEDGRGRPRVPSTANPRVAPCRFCAREHGTSVHELSEHPQCRPQGRQVSIQELEAKILFLLPTRARCICTCMQACQARCCCSNLLASKRRLDEDREMRSPVRVWRPNILPARC